MATNSPITKVCPKCERDLSIADFWFASKAKGVRHSHCKTCMREAAKDYRKASDVPKQATLAWRERNPDKVAAHEAKRVRMPGYNRVSSARWRARNPELAKARPKASAAKKPEYHKEKRKEWKALNHEMLRAQDARRRARKANAPGDGWTEADILAIHGAQRGRCGYCRVKLGKSFHRDHIQPLSKGGKHCRTNCQLLCGPCNVSKHARDPIDHARTLGLLL